MLVRLLKRRMVIALIFFSLGFAFNAYLTASNVPILGLSPPGDRVSAVKMLLTLPSNSENKKVPPLVNEVDFNGNNFSKNQVQIEQGRYIGIKNTSNSQLMWLVSNNSQLNTNRGFGQSEMLKALLTEPGTYQVIDKLNPSTVLTVDVYRPS